MQIFASYLVMLGFLCIVIATILMFSFRLTDIKFNDFLAKGSLVFRNLKGHVLAFWVKPIYALTYFGLSCILIAIFGLLAFKFSGL